MQSRRLLIRGSVAVSRLRAQSALVVWKRMVSVRRRHHLADAQLVKAWPTAQRRVWFNAWKVNRTRHAAVGVILHRASNHIMSHGAAHLLAYWRYWVRSRKHHRQLMQYAVSHNTTAIARDSWKVWRTAFGVRQIEHDLSMRVDLLKRHSAVRSWVMFVMERRKNAHIRSTADAMCARHSARRSIRALRANAARGKRLRAEHSEVVKRSIRLSKQHTIRHLRWAVVTRAANHRTDQAQTAVAYTHFQKRAFMAWRAATKRFKILKQIAADVRSTVAFRLLRRCAYFWVDETRRSLHVKSNDAVWTKQAIESDRRRTLRSVFNGWRTVRVTHSIRRWQLAGAVQRWKRFVVRRRARSTHLSDQYRSAQLLRQAQIRRVGWRLWRMALAERRDMHQVMTSCDSMAKRNRLQRAIKLWRTFSGKRKVHRIHDSTLTNKLVVVHTR